MSTRIAAAGPARIVGVLSAAWLIAFCAPARKSPGQAWGDPQRMGAGVNVPLAMTLAPFVTADLTCFNRIDLYIAPSTCR